MPHLNIEELEYSDEWLYTYRGEPYTGTAYEHAANGQLVAETSYVDGLQHGLQRLWYPSGAKMKELTCFRDGLHGERFEWYENGRVKEWARGELSIVLESEEWDADGIHTKSYRIDPNGSSYRHLIQSRELKIKFNW